MANNLDPPTGPADRADTDGEAPPADRAPGVMQLAFEPLGRADLDSVFDDAERELARYDPEWARFAYGLRMMREGVRWERPALPREPGGSPDGARLTRAEDVVSRFDVYRDQFEAGRPLSVLDAVRLAAEQGVPLPEWCALAFIELWSLKRGAGIRSLDAVFARKQPGKKKREANREQKLRWGAPLWSEAVFAQAHEGADSMTAAVKRALEATGLPVTEDHAKDLVSERERTYRPFLGVRLQEFGQIRRKKGKT